MPTVERFCFISFLVPHANTGIVVHIRGVLPNRNHWYDMRPKRTRCPGPRRSNKSTSQEALLVTHGDKPTGRRLPLLELLQANHATHQMSIISREERISAAGLLQVTMEACGLSIRLAHRRAMRQQCLSYKDHAIAQFPAQEFPSSYCNLGET
ncbi:hypothetical protein B0T22DRAFT_202700 [Podospora appendiculata]|uniref:Uncharacterized protein n=1 Tax=Podospora appendiculata TaxID=314037 RepID=A0AAE0X4G7_9PEZI|nr:hypothetical protein B0T22DRAFT_202700 [Podospora appendiculata]